MIKGTALITLNIFNYIWKVCTCLGTVQETNKNDAISFVPAFHNNSASKLVHLHRMIVYVGVQFKITYLQQVVKYSGLDFFLKHDLDLEVVHILSCIIYHVVLHAKTNTLQPIFLEYALSLAFKLRDHTYLTQHHTANTCIWCSIVI